MLVSETKLDNSFPTAQFLFDGFSKPYRLDRCSNGGGILLYVKDISSRLLTDHRLPDNGKCLFTEINIRTKKWFLCCPCNPHRNNISNHISHMSKGLDNYISHYDIFFWEILILNHRKTVWMISAMYVIFQILSKNQYVIKTLIIHLVSICF